MEISGFPGFGVLTINVLNSYHHKQPSGCEKDTLFWIDLFISRFILDLEVDSVYTNISLQLTLITTSC
jgi:hypothetical protein